MPRTATASGILVFFLAVSAVLGANASMAHVNHWDRDVPRTHGAAGRIGVRGDPRGCVARRCTSGGHRQHTRRVARQSAHRVHDPLRAVQGRQQSSIRRSRDDSARRWRDGDGKLLFTTDTAVPVTLSGSAAKILLLLRRVGAAEGAQVPSSPGLAGTSWQLVKFQGGDDTTVMPDDGAKYTIAFADGGELTARIDCNRGRGTWKSGGPSQVQFGPLALTRAACPPGSLHDRIVKQWSYVRSYVIKDGHLFLSLDGRRRDLRIRATPSRPHREPLLH